jgi:hypothetical protein
VIEGSSPAGRSPRPPYTGLAVARALGFAAAALAFATSAGGILVGGVYVGLACQACTGTDGDWIVTSLVLTFAIAVVGFFGVLLAESRVWLLAGVETVAAAGMVVALAFVALDGGDMRLDATSRMDASFLYVLFALIAFLFLLGAILTQLAAAEIAPPVDSAGQADRLIVAPCLAGGGPVIDELREASDLIARGNFRDGLDALKEARRIAVAQGYPDRLPHIAKLAELISAETTGRLHRQSSRLGQQPTTPPSRPG